MKKKIYLCPKCERALNFSDNPEYTFYCADCNEDFYEFEAIVKEQGKLEGIKDYTGLVKASMEVKEITNTAIESNNKYIEFKGKGILEQVMTYIHETIKPILETDIHTTCRFRDCAAIYYGKLQLKFGDFRLGDDVFNACLFIRGDRFYDDLRFMYFNAMMCVADEITNDKLILLVENWSGLKESMNRMIEYALEECNKANEKKLEKQKEMSDIIDNFRL